MNYLQGKLDVGGVYQIEIQLAICIQVFNQFMENNNHKTLQTYVNIFNKL